MFLLLLFLSVLFLGFLKTFYKFRTWRLEQKLARKTVLKIVGRVIFFVSEKAMPDSF